MLPLRWPWHAPLDAQRWVVLDTESSGLDAARDRLISVAAVAVKFAAGRASIALHDSFEVVLRQDGAPSTPDKHNILLHRIGAGAQAEGVDPVAALRAFTAYVGSSPLLAFHAAFDRAMLSGATQARLGSTLRNPWLDIEHVAAVIHPEVKARSLDEWMQALDIRCVARHQASADALASAEVFLRLWPILNAQGAGTFGATRRLAQRHRWLR